MVSSFSSSWRMKRWRSFSWHCATFALSASVRASHLISASLWCVPSDSLPSKANLAMSCQSSLSKQTSLPSRSQTSRSASFRAISSQMCLRGLTYKWRICMGSPTCFSSMEHWHIVGLKSSSPNSFSAQSWHSWFQSFSSSWTASVTTSRTVASSFHSLWPSRPRFSSGWKEYCTSTTATASFTAFLASIAQIWPHS